MAWAPSLWLGLQTAGLEGKGCFLPGWKLLLVQRLPGGPGPLTYKLAPPSKPFQEEAQASHWDPDASWRPNSTDLFN